MIHDPFFSRLAERVGSRSRATPLSRREREVLALLLGGHSNREIAEALRVSAHTVKNHVYHVCQKTGAGGRVELLLSGILESRELAIPDPTPCDLEATVRLRPPQGG